MPADEISTSEEVLLLSDSYRKTEKTLHAILFNNTNSKVDVLINLNSLIYRILNSETTIEWLNNVTASFQTTVNSRGWIALDTFINVLGNSFSIYDAIGGGVKRISDRANAKEEKKKNEEDKDVQKELNDELKSMAEMMNSKLTSINRLLGCFLTISEKDNEYNSVNDDCFTEYLQENDESNEIDTAKEEEEFYGALERKKMNNQVSSVNNANSEDFYSYDDRPDELKHYAVNLIYAMLHVFNA